MGWLVLKVNPGPEDRWCLWSTIAEGPVFDGTEEEMIQRYLYENGQCTLYGLMDRIERAKMCGAGTNWDGDWGPDSSLTMNGLRGSLPRHKLGDLLDLYERGCTDSDAEVQALIEPFDYGDE
jgi:hypothetical protein